MILAQERVDAMQREIDARVEFLDVTRRRFQSRVRDPARYPAGGGRRGEPDAGTASAPLRTPARRAGPEPAARARSHDADRRRCELPDRGRGDRTGDSALAGGPAAGPARTGGAVEDHRASARCRCRRTASVPERRGAMGIRDPRPRRSHGLRSRFLARGR